MVKKLIDKFLNKGELATVTFIIKAAYRGFAHVLY